MVMPCVAVTLHVPMELTKVTVFPPGVEYTTPVGFCEAEVAGAAPDPKSQFQAVPVPVLVKSTFCPVQAGAVEEKLDVGAGLIKMVFDTVPSQAPLETVNETVFEPDVL